MKPLAETVVDVALDFRLPPASVRAWDWMDFKAVLRAYDRRFKEANRAKARA